jgi:hypothetical protein
MQAPNLPVTYGKGKGDRLRILLWCPINHSTTRWKAMSGLTCVEKMLQEDHVTSAPSSSRVSIETKVRIIQKISIFFYNPPTPGFRNVPVLPS